MTSKPELLLCTWRLLHENTVRGKHSYYHENHKHDEFIVHGVDNILIKQNINSWNI